MRRILFVLIFIIFVVVYLLPESPMEARPMLTVPEGTPRTRRAAPVVIATPVSVDSGQWTVDSEEERSSLGGGFNTGGGRLAPDKSEEVADQELSSVQYPLSTQLSVLPTFAMQDEEIIFSVTVSHEHESTSDEKCGLPMMLW